MQSSTSATLSRSETNAKRWHLVDPVSTHAPGSHFLAKVPDFISENVYFDQQSLMYSAFGVVLLVVPDPENTSKC